MTFTRWPIVRGRYPTHERALKAMYEQRDSDFFQWKILDRPEGFVLLMAPLWFVFEDEEVAA